MRNHLKFINLIHQVRGLIGDSELLKEFMRYQISEFQMIPHDSFLMIQQNGFLKILSWMPFFMSHEKRHSWQNFQKSVLLSKLFIRSYTKFFIVLMCILYQSDKISIKSYNISLDIRFTKYLSFYLLRFYFLLKLFVNYLRILKSVQTIKILVKKW